MAPTFAQAALGRLDGLWRGLYDAPCPERTRALVATLMAPWGSGGIPDAPEWRSDIGDDHSPFEYSVAFGQPPELRFLLEAQGGDGAARRRAVLALNETLGMMGADLSRFHQVADLFLPETRELGQPLFLLWHTISLAPGPLKVKCYLNPSVRGAPGAMPLVRAAFERLGLPKAWNTFESAQRQLAINEVFLFCLDLEKSESARVKAYSQPAGATADDLEALARLGAHHRPGEVSDFCQAITGSAGPYRYSPGITRLPSVYFSFTRDEAIPSDITIQIPIRFYAADDRVAADRIGAYLRSRGVDAGRYQRALGAVATRPLERGRGLNAWVSLRCGTDPPLVTVYFAAELYRVLAPVEDSP